VAPSTYGGQAVIEGVMVRGPARWAVAVRQPDGAVWVESHALPAPGDRAALLRRPLLRGVPVLLDSLAVGARALQVALQHGTTELQQDANPPPSARAGLLQALALLTVVFVVVPSTLAVLVGAFVEPVGAGVGLHLLEALLRAAVLVAYLWSLSLLADIRRVFAYHGAEHRAIAAWEDGRVLSPEVVRAYPTAHPRCGTGFLVLVVLVAALVFTLVGVVLPLPSAGVLVPLLANLGMRVVLLPLVVGIAYEALRAGALGDGPAGLLAAPGLWLQRITTRDGDDGQLEVAIRALQAVLPADERDVRVDGGSLPSPLTGPAGTVGPGVRSPDARPSDARSPDTRPPGDPEPADG